MYANFIILDVNDPRFNFIEIHRVMENFLRRAFERVNKQNSK